MEERLGLDRLSVFSHDFHEQVLEADPVVELSERNVAWRSDSVDDVANVSPWVLVFLVQLNALAHLEDPLRFVILFT